MDEYEIVDVPAQRTAVIPGRTTLAELPSFFDAAFTELGGLIGTGALVPLGPPFARYLSDPSVELDLEVGFPVGEAATAGRVVPGELPAARAAHAVHHGAYDGLGETWGRLLAWATEQGLTPAGAVWEVYLDDPDTTAVQDLRTSLYLPVA